MLEENNKKNIIINSKYGLICYKNDIFCLYINYIFNSFFNDEKINIQIINIKELVYYQKKIYFLSIEIINKSSKKIDLLTVKRFETMLINMINKRININLIALTKLS